MIFPSGNGHEDAEGSSTSNFWMGEICDVPIKVQVVSVLGRVFFGHQESRGVK